MMSLEDLLNGIGMEKKRIAGFLHQVASDQEVIEKCMEMICEILRTASDRTSGAGFLHLLYMLKEATDGSLEESSKLLDPNGILKEAWEKSSR